MMLTPEKIDGVIILTWLAGTLILLYLFEACWHLNLALLIRGLLMLIFLLSFAFACDSFKTTCQVVCLHDGDQIGIVINKDCYCANQRDISKIVPRVPKSITYKDTKKRSWLDELH